MNENHNLDKLSKHFIEYANQCLQKKPPYILIRLKQIISGKTVVSEYLPFWNKVLIYCFRPAVFLLITSIIILTFQLLNKSTIADQVKIIPVPKPYRVTKPVSIPIPPVVEKLSVISFPMQYDIKSQSELDIKTIRENLKNISNLSILSIDNTSIYLNINYDNIFNVKYKITKNIENKFDITCFSDSIPDNKKNDLENKYLKRVTQQLAQITELIKGL